MSPDDVVAAAAAASAPGKVLFAGGFLVLDRTHTGLVFGLDARIHVHVQSWEDEEKEGEEGKACSVLVQSPQFEDAKWLYTVSPAPVDLVNGARPAVHVQQVHDRVGYTTTANKFVETTLRYALTYLSHFSTVNWGPVKITILADDDYYSHSPSTGPETGLHSSRSLLKFTDFHVRLSDAHKTGLGSSAALVTALVSALMAYHLPASTMPYKAIHNLAQAAHCAAQGKVGSGFDVAAAVYGSCLYRRFTPAILEAIGEPSAPGFSERLHRCVDDLERDHKWDVEVATGAVQMPDGLLLVMCDVDCGSETPGMVRKVLQWRKENSDEAALLWTALQQGTEDLCQEFRRLAQRDGIPEDGYKNLGDIIATIRRLVRDMSAKSAVPIEPYVITELLDFCTSLPGVVGGVAPGAGGYDAVALLVENDVEVVRALQERLHGWKSKDSRNGPAIGTVQLLGVKQEKEGVRPEEPGQYASWV